MEKKIITVEVGSIDWNCHPTVDEMITSLVELKQQGATHVNIDSYSDEWDGTAMVRFIPYMEREETDEEYSKRVAASKEADYIKEMHERAQLRYLKNKYKE